MEPQAALESAETVLRSIIRELMPAEAWLQAPGAPKKAVLERRRSQDQDKRPGVVVSTELLDYTDIGDLRAMIEKNWSIFLPVFEDEPRTLVYLRAVEDVRNTTAHSRGLVPYERDLLSGIAGHFRSQVTMYRSRTNSPGRYYASIESARDEFGRDGVTELYPSHRVHLEVGQVVTIEGRGSGPPGLALIWLFSTGGHTITGYPGQAEAIGQGDTFSYRYTVTEDDVGEDFQIVVRLRTDSKWPRNKTTPDPHDDERKFGFIVNPPLGR